MTEDRDSHINISKEEYQDLIHKVENKSFDWQGWIKVALSVIAPGVAIVLYISTIDSKVTQVQKDVARHERWIEAQDSKNDNINAAINRIANNQAVVIEKIDRAQLDIRRLVEKSGEE